MLNRLSKKMDNRKSKGFNKRASDGAKSSILIVDDEEVLQELMKIALTQQGYYVVPATSIGKSYDLLHTLVPDLIICDYWIGSQNGVKFIEWIREEDNLKDVPVLFVTTEDEIDGKVDHLDNCHTLAKPFSLVEFLGCVGKLLK